MAQEVAEILSGYDAFITYAPLRTEVPFRDFVVLPEGVKEYLIPARASLDPFMESRKALAFAEGKKVAVFMPGRKFDARGTRFGQGGGWYDRFLAEVPKEWLRVGFCFSTQFSPTPLMRQEWDRTMDYVVVVDDQTKTTTLYDAPKRA